MLYDDVVLTGGDLGDESEEESTMTLGCGDLHITDKK